MNLKRGGVELARGGRGCGNFYFHQHMETCAANEVDHLLTQGRSQDFSKGGGGGGSHCVKHYRHGVFATKYCRLFA